LKLEGIRRGSKNESCSLSLEEKDTKYTLLKTSRNEKKNAERKTGFVKYFEYKGKSDFYETK
jgi:hypothetical protein